MEGLVKFHGVIDDCVTLNNLWYPDVYILVIITTNKLKTTFISFDEPL